MSNREPVGTCYMTGSSSRCLVMTWSAGSGWGGDGKGVGGKAKRKGTYAYLQLIHVDI